MWLNTVGARTSAQAPRRHHNLATTLDAVSFFYCYCSEIVPDETNTNTSFWPITAIKLRGHNYLDAIEASIVIVQPITTQFKLINFARRLSLR